MSSPSPGDGCGKEAVLSGARVLEQRQLLCKGMENIVGGGVRKRFLANGYAWEALRRVTDV